MSESINSTNNSGITATMRLTSDTVEKKQQPYFRGSKYETSPQQDTVEISGKEQPKQSWFQKYKKGLVAAGVGALAIGAAILGHKKISAEQVKKVEEEARKLEQEVRQKAAKAEEKVESKTKPEVAEIAIIKTKEDVIDLKNVVIQESESDKQLNCISVIPKDGITDSRGICALEECKNLTFDSPNLNLIKDHYDNFLNGRDGSGNIFDLGFRYAIVANNTAKIKGSGALVNEIPKVFEGINEKELVQNLDKLPVFLTPNGVNNFSIGGKNLTATYIGGGKYNDVYLISDEVGNKVCFRLSRDLYSNPGGHGVYKEFAIAQEAYKAEVVDVPKMYMGNPVGKYVNNGCRQGGWQIIEYIDQNCSKPKDGLKLLDWLHLKGLEHMDINEGTVINGYFVDLGGIRDDVFFTDMVVGDFSWLPKAYNSGKDAESVLKELKTN